MKPIKVILADDHDLVRAGIRSLLDKLQDVEVVAEAASGDEVLSLVASHQPDVVLMDLLMPGLNGLEALARVQQEHPAVRVIFLSIEAGKPFVLQALRCGAAGYLLKNVSPDELAHAIHAVTRGETYLHSAISKFVVEGLLKEEVGEIPSPDQLTPRQREILELVARGNTTKVIARKLGISVKTVEMHRSDLMKALGIGDITGLVRYAIRTGVISAED